MLIPRTHVKKDTLDFIVIGAQKAGTTSLFEYLRFHPELSLPAGKEAPYFRDDDTIARGWDLYMASTFPFADPSHKWGTVTPQYMLGGPYSPTNATLPDGSHDERTVPLRILERLPNVRLIAILRDPVERARSHYRMAAMDGFEERSFDEAIRDLLTKDGLERSQKQPAIDTGYVAWSEYGRILTGYFDVVPREQILVLFTAELEQAPDQVLRRVLDFLDVAPDFVPDNLGTVYRPSAASRRISWLGPYGGHWSPLHKAIARSITGNTIASALWRALPEAARRRIGQRLTHAAYRLDLWNRRGRPDFDEASPATLARLREHFVADGQRLAMLLGEAPPW